ncbi:ALP1-like protein [Tanacetum coccineum]
MSDSTVGMSDLDDIDDMEMIMQQLRYEQSLQEQEAESSNRRNYIYRERDVAEERLMADYFGDNPKYPASYFKKRYRIRRKLFLEIVEGKPDLNDIQKLYNAHNMIHGFSGMLGSIECMHWEWKNYPKEWHGQFARGDKKYPTIMLEAVASYDLWIWHAFFGVAGADNDITVLNNSSLFDDLLDDIAHVALFEVNEVTFQQGYYMTDGIYPQWSSFIKSFRLQIQRKMHYLNGNKKVLEKTMKELLGSFKDVGILYAN